MSSPQSANKSKFDSPPTENELVKYPDGWDEKCCLKHFLGKTQEDVEKMFNKYHGGGYTEDFTYMTAAGLCYYLPPAFNYLKSESSNEDWEMAHGLMCALSSSITCFGMSGDPIPLIKEIAEYCAANKSKFNIDDSELFDGYLTDIRNATQDNSIKVRKSKKG
jgi:hypothetical protein